MSVTDSYTQSQTRLQTSVTELNVATAHWRRNAANAHLAADTYNRGEKVVRSAIVVREIPTAAAAKNGTKTARFRQSKIAARCAFAALRRQWAVAVFSSVTELRSRVWLCVWLSVTDIDI